MSYTVTKAEIKHDDAPSDPASPIFKSEANVGGGESSVAVGENPPILKFERADWTLFRTVEGLQQKAGVPATRLRRLVLKELGDNSLDTATTIHFGQIDDHLFFVEDNGPGLDGTPEEIAELFSIRRPMRSTKLLRLPQRGALGNGLRVVAGAVLASEGSLAIVTRNQRIVLRPQAHGSTTVVEVTEVDHPIGTRIEIGFGQALPEDADTLAWAHAAKAVAFLGKVYEGRSSPFWYDAAQFNELLLASGSQPVRSLIAQLDGCTGAKAGEIVAAAGLDRMRSQDVTREQAAKLLTVACSHARPVNPERLGYVGPNAGKHYAAERGTVKLGSLEPRADVPFVIEAWVRKEASGDESVKVSVLINRTPSTADISSWRSGKRALCLRGSGLNHYTEGAPKKGAYDIKVNVTTPYCPITSDGKAPNLEPFADEIMAAIETAMRKAQRAAPKDKKQSQKDVVLDNLDDAIAAASGDDEYRFNERQLFYQLRPIVLEETGQELTIGNFKRVITDYENEHGEIEGMYREPRGSIYHPHRREDIPLGTLTVEDYERPFWTFNKLLYIEKEGFKEALKADGWPERHDCALMSSKGFTTRAARDLVDKLAEHDEPITIYCVHDADAFGTMIYQTFQEETRARDARKINIVNLGLEPWEAVDDDLEIEEVPKEEQHKAVASYVLERDDGDYWEEWLQTHRVELNAMTTPEFIAWLDAKIGDDKLVPPEDVIATELEEQLEAKVRTVVSERILREAGLEEQIADALAEIERPGGDALVDGIRASFESDPEREWREHIDEETVALTAEKSP